MKQEHFSQIIDGLMLGDGNIRIPKGGINASYQQGSKYKEFVVHVKDVFTNSAFICDKNIRVQIQEARNWAIGYHMRTRTYEYLTTQYYRWYSNHHKIVPTNLVFSPLVCNYWYLGDGGLHYKRNTFGGIRLCTQGFIRSDIEYLGSKLSELGFRNAIETKGVIVLSPIPARAFLSYIGKSPIKCYEYKWCVNNRIGYNQLKCSAEMDNQQLSSLNGKSSTTIPMEVDSSESKQRASTL